MKDLTRKFLSGLFALTLIFGFAACSDDDDDKGEPGKNNDEVLEKVMDSYVNTTALPTYKALAEAALEMRTANEALKNGVTDANMEAASAAWMKARIAWELNEAFLFGPIGKIGYDVDGHVDDWPLELEDIKRTLDTDAKDLTGKKAWLMEGNLIGFHVTEYLLYRDGQSRPAADMTDAELQYLTSATDALVWDCILAYVAWAGEDNVSAEMKTVFRENEDVIEHYNSRSDSQNFADRLTRKDKNTQYTTWEQATQEIVEGAITIAEEVGTQKIASPYEQGYVEEVESWYSWHSLDDYENNIISIRNAYLGGNGLNGTPSTVSLSTFVKEVDPALDTKIKNQINTCIQKIKAIGQGGKSFYEVVLAKADGDNSMDAVVDEAVKACLKLAEDFELINDHLK